MEKHATRLKERMLNGQMVMRLEDVAIADLLLDKVVGGATGEERATARRQFGLRALAPQASPAVGGQPRRQ